MLKYILNQDHNDLVSYTGDFHTMPIVVGNNVLLGVNLYDNNSLLKTCESVREALDTIESILSCTEDVYFVDGCKIQVSVGKLMDFNTSLEDD
jgi:hypothetical protein